MKKSVKFILTAYAVLFLFNCLLSQEFKVEQLEINISEVQNLQNEIIKEAVDKIDLQLQLFENIKGIDDNNRIILQNSTNAIKSFTNSIRQQLDIYKLSIENKKNEELNKIKELFARLLNELDKQKIILESLKTTSTDEIAKKLISEISSQLTKVEELTKSLEVTKSELSEKKDQVKNLEATNENYIKQINELNTVIAKQQGELKYFTNKNFKLGLSFGFNFFSKEYQYIVQPDHTAVEDIIKGASGITSAVLVIQPDTMFKRKNPFQLLLNVPLVEVGLNGDNTTVSSIFNKQVALGIGLGWEFAKNISLCGIFNIRRIKCIDATSLSYKNSNALFPEQAFEIADLDKNATTNIANFTFTIGVVIKLGQ